MDACPHCRGPVAAYGVYKHRWWVCARCGAATRAARPALLADRLPSRLQARLPPRLRRAGAADPFFARPRADTGAAELAEVEGLLRRVGIGAAGRILDVGGGPGFVAAGLGQRASVVLLEHSAAALTHARGLGVDARAFSFEGPPVPEVAPGPFDLVLLRYAVSWCRDLPRLAAGLAAVCRPGARLVVTHVLPTRGACLGTALEDAAPAVLWSERALLEGLTAADWREEASFEPLPPLPFWAPHRRGYALASAPWALRPGPLPPDLHQRHAGRVFSRGP